MASETIESPQDFVKPGWTWISLPAIPDNPYAGAIFNDDGVDYARNHLYWWDPVRKAYLLYPDDFQNVVYKDGYMLSSESAMRTVAYQGTPQTTDQEILLPSQGRTWIGHPFLYSVDLNDCSVRNNATQEVRTCAEDRANPNPWINWNFVTWDNVRRTYVIVDPVGDPHHLWAWYAYYLWSQIENVTLIVPTPYPDPPELLDAEAGNGKVLLAWPTVDMPAVTGYKIYRQVGGVGEFDPLATTTGNWYQDTAVTNGVAYAYKVSSHNAQGPESDPAGPASANPSSTLPACVVDTVVVDDNGLLTLEAHGTGPNGAEPSAALLFVDGDFCDQAGIWSGYSATLRVDTQELTNGEHVAEVHFDFGGDPDGYVLSETFVTGNYLSEWDVRPEEYGARVSGRFAEESAWALVIKNAYGTAVRHVSGLSAQLDFAWDGKNDEGAFEPDGTYTAELQAKDPQTQDPRAYNEGAFPKKGKSTSRADDYLVTYCYDVVDWPAFSAIADDANGELYGHFTPIYPAPPYYIGMASPQAYEEVLDYYLEGKANIIYFCTGHGWYSAIGGWYAGDHTNGPFACHSPMFSNVVVDHFYEYGVGPALGNTWTRGIDGKVTQWRISLPYKFVFLDACLSGRIYPPGKPRAPGVKYGPWPLAFGISYYSAPGMRRAFLGWTRNVTNQHSEQFCKYFWDRIRQNYSVEEAVALAVADANAHLPAGKLLGPGSLRICGDKDLKPWTQ
jgi:hypothetical protein